MMPGISGIELAKKARELIPDIHILLASGYTDPAIINDNGAPKEYQFINKPYRVSDVVKKLRLAN